MVSTNGAITRPVSLIIGASFLTLGVVATQYIENSTAAEIALFEEARAKSLKAIESIELLSAQLLEASTDDQLVGIWLVGSETEAATALQARLAAAATAGGVSLRVISPTRPRQGTGATTVGIRIEAEAPLDRLVALMAEIEHQPPLAVISRANFRRVTKNNPNQQQPTVFFQLEVIAPYEIEVDRP